MGGCIGRSRSRPSSGESSDGSNLHPHVSIGKNQPLKNERPKWKSDVPLTDGQLRSKRDEFWDTAPAFEGRKEIWDALKAAAYAAENNDYALAQAIVDGANISLPNGTLLDCYDELGNRYQLPIYCVSAPINLIEEGSDSESPSPESEPVAPGMGGEEIVVKFRISTSCNDVKMGVFTKETIFSAKRKLANIENIEPSKQRWYFGGRLLSDKLKIEDVKLQGGFVVQVVVSPTQSTSSSVTNVAAGGGVKNHSRRHSMKTDDSYDSDVLADN